jgi:hypothetical protein
LAREEVANVFERRRFRGLFQRRAERFAYTIVVERFESAADFGERQVLALKAPD